jgi:hypothetical protein
MMTTESTQAPESLGSPHSYPRLRRGQRVRVRPEGFREYFAGVVEGPCNGLYSSENVYGVSGPAFGLTRAHVGDMILG